MDPNSFAILSKEAAFVLDDVYAKVSSCYGIPLRHGGWTGLDLSEYHDMIPVNGYEGELRRFFREATSWIAIDPACGIRLTNDPEILQLINVKAEIYPNALLDCLCSEKDDAGDDFIFPHEALYVYRHAADRQVLSLEFDQLCEKVFEYDPTR